MSWLKKLLRRVIKSGSKDITITDSESYAEFLNQLSLNNPFRALTGKEAEAVTVMDNRDLFTSATPPNN